MHRKTMTWQDQLQAYPTEQLNTASHILTMVYSLSTELSQDPVIYTTNNTIWIYYERSCFECDTLLDEYGISVATVSRKYPLTLCGSAFGKETAELKAVFNAQNDKVLLQKWDISGKDFDQMANLCLKLLIDDAVAKNELHAMLKNVSYKHDFIALKRTAFTEKEFANLPQLSPDSYYRFIPMPDLEEAAYYLAALDNCHFIPVPDVNDLESYGPSLDGYRFVPLPAGGDLVSSVVELSIEQQKELWLVFLVDRISPLEFLYVLQRANKGSLPSFFTWELSLRLAMNEEGIQILYDTNGFEIKDRNGKRLIYDFISGSAAEKLFLKIIFPTPQAK